MALPKLDSKLQLIDFAIDALRSSSGKPLHRLLFELVKLRLSRNQLGVSEYFDYGLYDSARFPDNSIYSYVGRRVDAPLMKRMNSQAWIAIEQDKLLFSTLMHAHTLPHPRLKAFYSDRYRPAPDAPSFNDPEALVNFLRDRMIYPFFSKPVDGVRSRGALAVGCYRPDSDSLELLDGTLVKVKDFVGNLTKPWRVDGKRIFRGHIFQELVVPSKEVLELLPVTGLPTVRMVFLYDKPEPELFRAVWKLPLDGNMADNFWRKGNMIIDIDTRNGTIRRAIKSTSNGFEVSADDDNDPLSILGRRVPMWKEAVNVCKSAATLFPESRCQHWDVAISNKGPMLVEFQSEGDLALLQSVGSLGFLDARLEQCLDNLGIEWRHSLF